MTIFTADVKHANDTQSLVNGNELSVGTTNTDQL